MVDFSRVQFGAPTNQSFSPDSSDFTISTSGLLLFTRIAMLAVSLMLEVIDNGVKGFYSGGSFLAYAIWFGLYALIAVLSAVFPKTLVEPTHLPSPNGLIDIAMMAAFTHIGGGIESGYAVTILPFLVTSCLMSHGKHGFTYASFATVLLIFSTLVNQNSLSIQLLQKDAWYVPKIFQTGIFGAICFAVAAIASWLAKRLALSVQTMQHQSAGLKELDRLNQTILDLIHEAVLVVDQQGVIHQHNDYAQALMTNLSDALIQQELSPIMALWRQNPAQGFESRARCFGADFYLQAQPIVYKEQHMLAVYLRNALELAAEAQAAKLASLGRLTANIAHEIRNPMSAIRQAAELLQEDASDPLSLKLLGMIDGNVHRIDQLIEEILVLGKRDTVIKEWLALKPFSQDFLQEFVLANPNARGCIKLDIAPSVTEIHFSPLHLRQILWNLINNAWRHSQHNENAVLIAARPVANMRLSLQITDNGQGVPEELRARIFEPFFTTAERGTGLGLYVAAELAQANGAQLKYSPPINGFELIMKELK